MNLHDIIYITIMSVITVFIDIKKNTIIKILNQINVLQRLEPMFIGFKTKNSTSTP